MTEEDAAGFVEEVGLATVSSSTFHRELPRAIAALYEAKRPVIEKAIREQDEIPATAVTVQAGIDGVMVPPRMVNTRCREVARPTARVLLVTVSSEAGRLNTTG